MYLYAYINIYVCICVSVRERTILRVGTLNDWPQRPQLVWRTLLIIHCSPCSHCVQTSS